VLKFYYTDLLSVCLSGRGRQGKGLHVNLCDPCLSAFVVNRDKGVIKYLYHSLLQRGYEKLTIFKRLTLL